MTPDRKEKQFRRLQAGARLLKGDRQGQVARDYGVSRTTVSRWAKEVLRGGLEALRARRAPGRPWRITPEQKQKIAEIWAKGPRAYGIEKLRWTCAALTPVLYQEIGVAYDPDHVGRILIKMGLRLKRKRGPSRGGQF